MTIERELADVVVSTLHSALAPVRADLKAMQAQVSGWETRWSDIGALRERLAVIEDRAKSVQAVPVSAVLETIEGVDLTPVLARLDALEIRAEAPGPVGPAGKDGVNGKDALVDLDEIAVRAALLIPVPADGNDGINGKDGADGLHGKDAPAVDLEDVARRAALLVPKALNGEDGRDGQPGVPGVPGRDGAPGERGEKGLDGAAGRDGTLEGVTVKALDERTFELVRVDGAPMGHLAFPVPLYKGVYVAGTGYAKGDSVTFGGSLWIAREGTRDKPGDGATAWQLAVKAGREGREGKQGPEGGRGPQGAPGAPGRNFS